MIPDARLFWTSAALLTAFRLWLAATFPFTGDEAYFYWWGKFPDWGFYDHPPMVGWWLASLLPLSEAPLVLRLPQVLAPLLLAFAVRALWPRFFPSRAERRNLAALAMLAAPVSVWNVFITTDTPLVVFSVLAGLFWLRARCDDDWRWFLASGLALAGAVLSKYFAALIGFAFLVDVAARRSRGAFRGLLLTYAPTLPALALMAGWNAEHCWSNYLFNFVNRHDAGNTGLNAATPALYLATLAYLLLPALPWLLRRLPSADFPHADDERASAATLARLACVPILLFALLSLVKKIGLHWLLAFVPFAYWWLLVRLPRASLPRFTVTLVAIAAVHLMLILGGSRLPLESWQRFSFYPSLVLTLEGPALVAQAKPPAGALLTSDGYSNAATLGFQLKRYVPVLGPGSGHARHDDILTDWRQHEGRTIVLLRKTAPNEAELARYRAWFSAVEVSEFSFRGARFWRVIGKDFRYAAYRDDVLDEIRRRYYAVPSWLPMTGCYFCQRYFPERPCRR